MSIVDVTADLATEEVVDLSDFEETSTGALPEGWYAAEVIEGYTTRKGKVFQVEDTPSRDGTSRNFRLCFLIEGRNMQSTFNYRPADFSPARVKEVKAAREAHKGVEGRWADAPDMQRTSLALVKIANLEKALTPVPDAKLVIHTTEGVAPLRAVGAKLDVRLVKDKESGFNEVVDFAKLGARSVKK